MFVCVCEHDSFLFPKKKKESWRSFFFVVVAIVFDTEKIGYIFFLPKKKTEIEHFVELIKFFPSLLACHPFVVGATLF